MKINQNLGFLNSGTYLQFNIMVWKSFCLVPYRQWAYMHQQYFKAQYPLEPTS